MEEKLAQNLWTCFKDLVSPHTSLVSRLSAEEKMTQYLCPTTVHSKIQELQKYLNEWVNGKTLISYCKVRLIEMSCCLNLSFLSPSFSLRFLSGLPIQQVSMSLYLELFVNLSSLEKPEVIVLL